MHCVTLLMFRARIHLTRRSVSCSLYMRRITCCSFPCSVLRRQQETFPFDLITFVDTGQLLRQGVRSFVSCDPIPALTSRFVVHAMQHPLSRTVDGQHYAPLRRPLTPTFNVGSTSACQQNENPNKKIHGPNYQFPVLTRVNDKTKEQCLRIPTA